MSSCNGRPANRLLRKRVAMWLAQQASTPGQAIASAERERIERCIKGLPVARRRRFAEAFENYQALIIYEAQPRDTGTGAFRYSGEIQRQLELMLEEILL
ncbi:MAG: hypothetical protein AAF098_02025 [Pseudomonadota bacterium]